MANEIKKELIQKKLDLVIQKLMHLGAPENEDTLKEGGEAIGFFSRDFGIKEWDWPQGIGLYGLLKIAKIQDSEEYRTFLHDWFKENIAQGLPSRNINTTTPLLTLCELNEIYHAPEFEALCLDWAKWLMECIPRTREGGFQHVTSANGDRQGVRLNESEMWIDTLFMTVLFLNRMGQKYGKQEWIDESIKQVLMHIKYLYDTHTGLFFHGWSFNRMDNFGGVFWCRGNSWSTLGILDYLDMFKGTLNQGVKTFILDTYKAQVRALRDLQGEDGLWHTVLDDSTSYEETSGSAAITAGILKGIRMGILDDSYLPCAKKAIRAILKNIDTDGTVLKVSGGTGMGYDRDHYKNILIEMCIRDSSKCDPLTLASPNEETRKFWVEHGKACIRISQYLAEELGQPCTMNIWTGDGFKDVPADRKGPRDRYKASIDEILSEPYDFKLVKPCIESKVFGIGVEAYTVGSAEFALSYACLLYTSRCV